MTTVQITDETLDTFDDVREQVTDDVEAGHVDAEIAERGRRAGEVTAEEAVRVVCEAYLGEADFSSFSIDS